MRSPDVEPTGEEFREEFIAALALGEMGNVVTGFSHELLSSLLHSDSQTAPEAQSGPSDPTVDDPEETHA